MLNDDNADRPTRGIPNDPRPYRPEYEPEPVTPDDAGREDAREGAEEYAEAGRGIPAWDEAEAILQEEERDSGAGRRAAQGAPVERESLDVADAAPDEEHP